MDEVIAFGDGRGFGLLSRAHGARRRAPTVVLLNAGLTHRIGPFRIYVRLARRLAAEGFDVLRFDLPRVGDGDARPAESAEAVVTGVLDTLQQRAGAREFVLGGICSASDLAWRIVQNEPRVSGLLLYDAFADRGPWFRIARLRRALARPLAQWPGLAWRVLGRLRVQKPATGFDAQSARDWPEPAVFRAQTAALLDRGVQILAMYTGGVSKYLLHPRQLGTTFGMKRPDPRLELHYWPDYDHLLLPPDDRERMVDTVVAWCRKWSLPAELERAA